MYTRGCVLRHLSCRGSRRWGRCGVRSDTGCKGAAKGQPSTVLTRACSLAVGLADHSLASLGGLWEICANTRLESFRVLCGWIKFS